MIRNCIPLAVMMFVIAACAPTTPAPTLISKPMNSPTPAVSLPRVFTVDPKAIADAKARFASGDKQILSSVDWLTFEADRALRAQPGSVTEKKVAPPSRDMHDYMSVAPYWWPDPTKPDGLPYIRKDGQTNPEIHTIPDKDNLNAMSSNVYTLALAYYFKSDERYAEQAVRMMRVWFLNPDTRMNPNLNYGQAVRGVTDGRAEGVLETRAFGKVVDAIGLLADYKGFTSADREALARWFGDYAEWMTTSRVGKDERAAENNHGTWYDAQLVSYLLFLGKNDDAKKILEAAKNQRIGNQIETSGEMSRETERADAWHYTVFNLDAFFWLTTLGDRAGVDLWNYSTTDGRGIRKALDYLVRYIVDEKWPHSTSSDLSWGDIYNLLRQAAVKYGAVDYQLISSRIPTIDSSTARINLLLPQFVATSAQASPTIARVQPTTPSDSLAALTICNFDDDISIWQGYSQDSETIVKESETPKPGYLPDFKLNAARQNRWYQPTAGFEKSTEQVKEGASAGKWANVAQNNRIVTSNIPHDWSKFQYISLWVYSAEANKSSVMLVAYSANRETNEEDYYHYKVILDWTGWKLFEVAFKEFTVTRNPAGWNKIDSLKLASTGWSQTPNPTTLLYFDSMKLADIRTTR